VRGEEAKIDLEAVAAAVAGREIIDLKALDVAARIDPALAVDAIPRGAAVVDLRAQDAYRAWHWPGAEQRDYFSALRGFAGWPRERRWVFYCEVGLKSAHLAEVMRQAGFDAWHVAGGVRPLLKQATAEDPLLRAALSPAVLD
jgi:thiamine biosynthesis protein ThiI